jgi:hypothetical protein
MAPDGTVTRYAGNGRRGHSGDGGRADQAQLGRPEGLAFDSDGALYIVDGEKHAVRKVTSNGFISTVAGTPGVAGFFGDDGPASVAQLSSPYDVAIDAQRNLFIADAANHRIRKVSPAGIISTVAGNGNQGSSGDGGPATAARLFFPWGIALDASGNLYLSDWSYRVRRVTPGGVIDAYAGSGTSGSSGDGGPAISAPLTQPTALAWSASGLLIADYYRVRRVSPAGAITTVAGNGSYGMVGDGYLATAAELATANGVTVDPAGNLHISTFGGLRKVSPAGIINTTGFYGQAYSGDNGQAASAQLFIPMAVAVGPSGEVHIADSYNHRIRRVSSGGTITTVAGTGVLATNFLPGGPALSIPLSAPNSIAFDAAGNLFISEACRVRKLDVAGFVSTYAGGGDCGYSGDGGLAVNAHLQGPSALALDGSGNLYIAESTACVVRKVAAATGIISTVAGNGTCGFSGDGGLATNASLNSPWGVAVDASGDLYIADQGNSRIRKVLSGVISTIAGNGDWYESGDGGQATQAGVPVTRIALDPTGNIFVAGRNRVRRISAATGVITSIAGNGIRGYSGDGGPALAAQLNDPSAVAVGSNGRLYVSDSSANAVRMLAPILPSRIGAFTAGRWRLDATGNGTLDATGDRDFPLGWAGATPVTGDWNGDGKTKAGVYSNGYWFLDQDGDGVYDNLVAWGWAGATPIVGDWNGDGKTKIGVYSNGFWFLDYNGDYQWDGGVVDKQVGWGWAGVTPIVGDWNGNGKTKIGVYANGFWFLDYNGDYQWDGGLVDKQVGWGWAGVTPIVGDWNGNGKTKIGVYSGGYWYLDYDGNYLWQYPGADRVWSVGWAGTIPVMGDWNGDGKTKAGAFINGYWYLDYDGNGTFDGAVRDRIYAFGAAGDAPVVGKW